MNRSRIIATIQGRPLGIRDETFDIESLTAYSLQTEIEGQDLPEDLRLSMKQLAACSLSHFKLDETVSEIKTVFYFLSNRINPSL